MQSHDFAALNAPSSTRTSLFRSEADQSRIERFEPNRFIGQLAPNVVQTIQVTSSISASARVDVRMPGRQRHIYARSNDVFWLIAYLRTWRTRWACTVESTSRAVTFRGTSYWSATGLTIRPDNGRDQFPTTISTVTILESSHQETPKIL